MPIGYTRGDGGGGRRGTRPASRPAAPRRADPWSRPAPSPTYDQLDPWRHDPEPADTDPWSHEAPEWAPTPEPLGFWTWVEVDASTVYPVAWTRWDTFADERVCPECGPLDGAVWEEGEGVTPPLHVNCRCQRVLAFVEWRVRPATTWELRWIPG